MRKKTLVALLTLLAPLGGMVSACSGADLDEVADVCLPGSIPVAGACRILCARDSDCPPSQTCDGTVCEAQEPFGCLECEVEGDLLAHYRFDEQQGGVAGDALERYPGAVQGVAEWLVPAPVGTGLRFDGATTWVNLERDETFLHSEISERTVALWLRTDRLRGPQTIYEEGGVLNGLSLRLNGTVLEAVAQSDNVAHPVAIGGWDERWHHVALVFSGPGRRLSLYVDGAEVATNSALDFATIPFHADAPGLGATHGRDCFDGPEGNHLAGVVDDVRLYERSLSDGELLRLMVGVSVPRGTPP